VISAAVAAALLALSSQANAQAQGLEVKLSGQVNRAIMHADDGVESEQFFVDNDNSGTRFRITATAPIRPGLTAGAIFEPEFQSNASNVVSMTDRDDPAELGERHMDVFLQGGWGKVSLGQGDGAANGGTEVDLSGTAVANWALTTLIGGGFGFRDDAGGFIGPTIGDSISNQDFESRYDRLRYDTPKFGGFSLAGSLGNKTEDVKEIALWYSGDLGGLGRLAGALGFSKENPTATTTEDEVTGGSVSWLHGSGFNVTLSRSQREFGGRDRDFTYAKLGYKFGRHAVSLDWGRGEDQAAAGVESDMVGVGYVWAPVAWADIYAAAKRHSLDVSGAEDINIFMVGTRVKF
jgi:hypothetical protein